MANLKKFVVQAEVTVRIRFDHEINADSYDEALEDAENSGVLEEVWVNHLSGSEMPEVEIEHIYEKKEK